MCFCNRCVIGILGVFSFRQLWLVHSVKTVKNIDVVREVAFFTNRMMNREDAKLTRFPEHQFKRRTRDVAVVKEVVVYRTIITVSPGMTSINVGEVLVRANIIDSAREFFNKVENRGLPIS